MKRHPKVKTGSYLLALLLAGCATKPVAPQYEGQSIDVLFERFGPADKTAELQDGYMYRWDIERNDTNPNLGAYSYSYQYRCEVTATTDKQKTITRYTTKSIDNHPYAEACEVLLKYAGGK